MSNPLLHIEGLPPFSQIKPEHIQPAIQKLIEENRQAIEQVLKQPHFTCLLYTSLTVLVQRYIYVLSYLVLVKISV